MTLHVGGSSTFHLRVLNKSEPQWTTQHENDRVKPTMQLQQLRKCWTRRLQSSDDKAMEVFASSWFGLDVCLFVRKVFCCPRDNNSRKPQSVQVLDCLSLPPTQRFGLEFTWSEFPYLNMFRLPFSEFPTTAKDKERISVYREKCTTRVFVWLELSISLLFGCVDRIPRVPVAQAVMENWKQSWFGCRWISISKVAHEALHFRMLESQYLEFKRRLAGSKKIAILGDNVNSLHHCIGHQRGSNAWNVLSGVLLDTMPQAISFIRLYQSWKSWIYF